MTDLWDLRHHPPAKRAEMLLANAAFYEAIADHLVGALNDTEDSRENIRLIRVNAELFRLEALDLQVPDDAYEGAA